MEYVLIFFYIIIIIIGIVGYFSIDSTKASDSERWMWQNENQKRIIRNITLGRTCENCGNHSKACDSPGMPHPCGLWEER